MAIALKEMSDSSPAVTAPLRVQTTLRRLFRSLAVIVLIALGAALACWVQLLIWHDKARSIPVSERTNRIRLTLKQWWLGRLCRVFGLKIHRKGGPWTGTVFMACNHISWLDIPILATSMPFHFLAKSEIRKWPIIGWLAAVAGTLFIRRGSGDSHSITRQLASYLSQGNSILFFPEGTTSDGSQILPFHSRLFESAIQSQVVIQPITLAYCESGRPHTVAPFIGDDSLVPHIWRILGEKQIHVHLHYHPPVRARDMTPKELAAQTQATIGQGLKKIFPLASQHSDERYKAVKRTVIRYVDSDTTITP